MKKKEWLLLLLLIVVVIFSSCKEVEQDNSKEDGPVTEIIAQAQSVEIEVPAEKELTIYYSNNSADGLETETILVKEITPESIIAGLAVRNIVSMDTKVNNFEQTKEDGNTILLLDMSKAFGEYLRTMGTSGETIILSALSNTFLDAYEADGVKLTVGGKTLETGHAIYDKPITYMEKNMGKTDAD